jgi:ABC-2 type transport system permease protein
MTAPITEAQVIAAKFLAAVTYFLFLWLPTVAYSVVIAYYEAVDWGPVAAGYLGILLIGSLFLSVGIFASATTKSQLVAFMMTFAVVLGLILLALFEEMLTNETVKQALSYVNLWNHLDEFSRGIVDSRRLVYYLSGSFFFLFLASRALADKKWR